MAESADDGKTKTTRQITTTQPTATDLIFTDETIAHDHNNQYLKSQLAWAISCIRHFCPDGVDLTESLQNRPITLAVAAS